MSWSGSVDLVTIRSGMAGKDRVGILGRRMGEARYGVVSNLILLALLFLRRQSVVLWLYVLGIVVILLFKC